jgi:hypothetical protein
MQSEIDTLHSRVQVYIRWHEETTAVLAAAFQGVPLDALKDEGYALRHAQHMLDFHERVRGENMRIRQFYGERMKELQKFQHELPEPQRSIICNILANGQQMP